MIYNEQRPEKFSQVVGQPAATALVNMLNKNRVAHSMLFSGKRGTGKTTLARLYAKAVNCSDLKKGEPCLKCRSCVSGNYLKEVDAGVYSKKVNVDVIQDFLQTSPEFKYNVVILEEAHALSKKAMIALLKMFEEPPPRSVIALTTTDPDKLDDALKSRCLWWPIHLISRELVRSKLSQVCREYKFPATKQGLDLLARISEGSMRDALSTLEALSSYGKITSMSVKRHTAVADVEDLVDLILNPDMPKMLMECERLTSLYSSKIILLTAARWVMEYAMRNVESADDKDDRVLVYARIAAYLNKNSGERTESIIEDTAHLQFVLVSLFESLGYAGAYKQEELEVSTWEAFTDSVEIGVSSGFYPASVVEELFLLSDVQVRLNGSVSYTHLLGDQVSPEIVESFNEFTDSVWEWVVTKPKKLRRRRR